MGIYNDPFPAQQSHRKITQIFYGNVVKKGKLILQYRTVLAAKNALHRHFDVVSYFRNHLDDF
ncbi:MAG: hypothetical protein RLZZ504_214, partial [Bacteroidota bacterium]